MRFAAIALFLQSVIAVPVAQDGDGNIDIPGEAIIFGDSIITALPEEQKILLQNAAGNIDIRTATYQSGNVNCRYEEPASPTAEAPATDANESNLGVGPYTIQPNAESKMLQITDQAGTATEQLEFRQGSVVCMFKEPDLSEFGIATL